MMETTYTQAQAKFSELFERVSTSGKDIALLNAIMQGIRNGLSLNDIKKLLT
jgi:hypothetical protein